MANSNINVKCGRCGVVAVLSPVGGGYSYSVSGIEVRQCPVVREMALRNGSSVPDIDCDHLLDAVSSEYKRLLRR